MFLIGILKHLASFKVALEVFKKMGFYDIYRCHLKLTVLVNGR